MRLAEKYAPKKVSELVGKKEAISAIITWLSAWKKGSALILTGPSGVGKTATAHIIAVERGLELLELGQEDMTGDVLPAVKQRGLLMKRRMVVLDNANSFSPSDLIQIIRSSAFPVLLITDDPWTSRMRTVRPLCEIVSFRKIPAFAMEGTLAEIASKENLRPKAPIKAFAELSGGDMRAAMIDLDSGLATRDRCSNVFETLRAVFRGPPSLAKASVESCDKDASSLMWWVEENIPAEFTDPRERAAAFELLSRFAVEKHRNRNHADMLAGFSQIRPRPDNRFVSYRQPRPQPASDNGLCLQLAAASHCSTRKIRSELSFMRSFVQTG